MNVFDLDRVGTGTNEWAEINENIVRGCSNGCIYCYAAHNANRRGTKNREDWANEEFTKRSKITSYTKRDGVIMFPTSHDITPFSIDTYLRIIKLMLEAGNKVLIVSKPKLECIKKLIEELTAFKDQILFRFTIGSMEEEVLKFWEPCATSPKERIESLKLAFDAGYHTSVSAEPLLGGMNTALEIVTNTRCYVTNTIWIGKLNKPRTRVIMDDPVYKEAVEKIEYYQQDGEIIAMYHLLKNDPKVRWKDSIKEVLERVK